MRNVSARHSLKEPPKGELNGIHNHSELFHNRAVNHTDLKPGKEAYTVMLEEIIINVTDNVIIIAMSLISVYAVMFILSYMVKFAGSMFSGTKLFTAFKFKEAENKKWDM